MKVDGKPIHMEQPVKKQSSISKAKAVESEKWNGPCMEEVDVEGKHVQFIMKSKGEQKRDDKD